MTETLYAVVAQRVAATITRRAGRLELVYDDDYRNRGEATPLSVSMPLATRRYQTPTVDHWLAGLLPDDPAVLRRWGRTFSVSPSSAFAMLSTPVGEDCAGAAAFVSAQRLEAALSGGGEIEWLTEGDVADRLRDLRKDSTAWLGTSFTGRFSLAGAQAKTALLWDQATGRWGVPSGAAATSHILKPAIEGLDGHDLNEHLCLQAAAGVGLLCAQTRLRRFEDQSAVVSTRYDRVSAGGPWLDRVHQEDLCQALAVPPDHRYQNEGGPSTSDVCAVLRRAVPADRVETDVWRFFDAVTFSWLVGGTDAHAKNYALLLAGSQARLAPLYDVASALPYPGVQVPKLRLAMKFGGYYTLDDRRDTLWRRLAQEFSLPADAVRARALALMDRVPSALAMAAGTAEVSELASDLPARLVHAVERRVDRLRQATIS